MNERLPWFQCYPTKLLGALAGMSADEKIVYVILILRIYEVRGACSDSLDAIARRSGISKVRTGKALDVLFSDGKLKRVGDGIMNPFAEVVLTAKEVLSEERAKAGANGGKKSAENRKQKQQIDPSKVGTNSTDLDSEEEKKEERQTQAPAEAGLFADDPRPQSDWPKDYQDQFWKAYPRRTEKKAAMAKLDAIRKGGKIPWQVFLAGVQRYAQHMRCTEERYIKHPTTWLNRGCWDDEFGATPGGGGPRPLGRNGALSLLARMTKGSDDDAQNMDPRRTLPAH